MIMGALNFYLYKIVNISFSIARVSEGLLPGVVLAAPFW